MLNFLVRGDSSLKIVNLRHGQESSVLTLKNVQQVALHLAEIMSMHEKLGLKIPAITDNMLVLEIDV